MPDAGHMNLAVVKQAEVEIRKSLRELSSREKPRKDLKVIWSLFNEKNYVDGG